MARRLHLVIKIDRTNRVTAVFRRLWGGYGAPEPVIRIHLNPPPESDWIWIMTSIAVEAHEVEVPEDFEAMTSQERYTLLRGAVMRIYEARRKQSRKT